ncbi:hypothetical protein M153_247000136 [Pseudoloma neurophilia]|uniref:Uncharacterized protein n=1 Tax=Pseudoloma neurophilia TaxID=146866 RepID=A0A0R0LYX4_9MICR|nr:hypothetical protein M153_247000136 [Pseudoloma neurophilia]
MIFFVYFRKMKNIREKIKINKKNEILRKINKIFKNHFSNGVI